MAINAPLIAELTFESASTRKLLERVPFENPAWVPHERSMPLAKLATHIADIPGWITRILSADEFDFVNNPPINIAKEKDVLMQNFESKLNAALESLQQATDADFDKIWTVKRNGTVMMQLPKKVAIRSWGLNHLVHHRGQLSVYLRLLNVPIPSMYGPSADEQ
ncbi:DinB family protein [Panacibacter ginsenosidivorans]|uniref:DinB family protein n=1 Tax=Panacibacter ginsenosidivorans TaxID=1813871 RepID=A0A5B8V9W8_9BACT|nr:DinB family protein [Panacibacter ginsenosidivorans]QEC68310.1 DinB family protein [Panacibacter ginsenosidivorans]